MNKIKKVFFISICIVTSIFSANIKKEIFIINSNQLLPLLFTLLGLCITAYTFIYSPIIDFLKDKYDAQINIKIEKLLNSFEDDMLLIFRLAILIIILDILINIDIPIVKDTEILQFNIESLKKWLYNFFMALSAMLSFYALYDLIKATFKILKKSFEKR